MFHYIAKLKKPITLEILFYLIYTVAVATIPYLSKLLFDYDLGRGWTGILWILLGYAGCCVVAAVAQNCSQVEGWKRSAAFDLYVKSDVIRGLFRRPVTEFQHHSIGDYLSVLNNDIPALNTSYLEAIIDIINKAVQVVVYAVVLFVFVDFRIALVILLASLLAVFVPRVTAGELSGRRKSYQSALGRYTARVQDLLSGFRFVNRHTCGPMAAEHDRTAAETEEAWLHFGRFKSFVIVFNNFVMDIVRLSAFAAIAVLLYRREITVGTAAATLGYIESFTLPVQYILENINEINSARGIREKVFALIRYQPPEQKRLEPSDACLVLDDVSVRYEKFRLQNIRYTFRPGKKYAVLGHNGSGKSTLFQAVMRYVALSGGKVMLDGQDLNGCDTADVIMNTDQQEHVFAASYRENVSVFGAYPTDRLDEVEKYLETDLLDTLRGKVDCTEFSGGQKQLLQLVRLLLAGRPVLLLDEPFSAVDETNRRLLERKLLGLPGRTILVITHDLTPEHLLRYDELLILQNGVLAAAGAPGDVLRTDAYRQLLQ